MTNTYKTGNPLGSTAAKDLSDNTSNLDEGMNSLSPVFLDRFGNRRETWWGMEVAFNAFLLASGFDFIGDYDADGPLTIFRQNQTFSKDGEYWRAGPGLTLPYTTVNNWAIDQPKFVNNGDASLRGDLISGDTARGSGLISFIQAGVGAIVRNLRGKLFELLSTSDYGGVDNNATDNTPAINSTKAAVGTGGVAKLVRRAGGTFLHSTPFDLNGLVLDNDPGLTLSVTQSIFNVITSAPARVARRLGLYFSDINANYPLYPLVQEDLAEKRIWLDDVDGDFSYRESFDLNALRQEKLVWGGASDDLWTAASNSIIGNNGGRAPYVNWGSGAAVTWYRSSFPVRVGDEFSACFPTSGVFNRACFVQHSGGYLVLYATGVAGGLNYARKDLGALPVQNTVGGVFTTQPQYYGENSKWVLKILSRRTFIITLNGVQVGDVLISPGDIMRGGFGFMPQGAINAASVSGFVRTRNNKVGGRNPEGITIFGDSTWIDQHGGTVDPLRKALYGMGGTTVASITDLAIAGTNAADMYARMQAVGFNGGTTVLGLITNDVQAQTDIATFLDTVFDMITYAKNHNQQVVVAEGRMWYNQSTAAATTGFAGQGQGSANAQNGAYHRCCLERLCSDLAVKYVDLTQVSGPVDSALLTNTTGANTLVWDNIHKTPYLSTAEAIAVAKAIFGMRSGPVKRRPEPEAIPMSYSAGWSAMSSPAPTGLLSDIGVYKLGGRINSPTSGVPTTGALVGQIREDRWPAVPDRVTVECSGGRCAGDIGTTGLIVLDGYQAGWTWVDLSAFELMTNA